MRKSVKVLLFLLGGGALLSVICSNQTSAATVTRQSNIKSHGTLEEKDTTSGRSVLFDSSDLRYLASECDKLETAINALSLQQDASIEYTYHHHTGSETSNAGCYTKGYHKHLSTCSKTTHQHDSSCYINDGEEKCDCVGFISNGSSEGYADYKCLRCGHVPHGSEPDSCHTMRPCTKLVCTKSTGDTYTCGSPINRWKLNCGWKEGEIESAVIVFQPSE